MQSDFTSEQAQILHKAPANAVVVKRIAVEELSPPAPGTAANCLPTDELHQKALCEPRNAALTAGSQRHVDSTGLQ